MDKGFYFHEKNGILVNTRQMGDTNGRDKRF